MQVRQSVLIFEYSNIDLDLVGRWGEGTGHDPHGNDGSGQETWTTTAGGEFKFVAMTAIFQPYCVAGEEWVNIYGHVSNMSAILWQEKSGLKFMAMSAIFWPYCDMVFKLLLKEDGLPGSEI